MCSHEDMILLFAHYASFKMAAGRRPLLVTRGDNSLFFLIFFYHFLSFLIILSFSVMVSVISVNVFVMISVIFCHYFVISVISVKVSVMLSIKGDRSLIKRRELFTFLDFKKKKKEKIGKKS